VRVFRRRRAKDFEAGVRVGITPSQSVANAAAPGATSAADAAFLDELWREGDAENYGLTRGEFDAILLRAGDAQNFGVAAGTIAPAQQRTSYLRGLKINDLVLARACAAGHERAWEHFVALYHEPLTRAATAITGNDTLGRELAGALYAELYGMTERDGERRCPLESYRGRGSLMGWLRTTLAQRHVDHHRRTHREQALDESQEDPPATEPAIAQSSAELASLARAVTEALGERQVEERFLLSAYYLDGRTLLQIARLLHVHEATVSRKLRRIAGGLRKQVLRNLQRQGMSRRAAEEALGADPRDVDVNVKKLLQSFTPGPFSEQPDRS
jgi:RNA polymerase sigma-70 factor, ECF subfamily